jgi:hypothetical protein
MFESADFMYIIPQYRFTVYAIGILLGISLHTFKHLKLSQQQLKIGWVFSMSSLAITALICAFNQTYSPFKDALFASIASITFNLCFAWIIFASHLGYKSRKTIGFNCENQTISVFCRHLLGTARVEILQNLHKPLVQHLPDSVCDFPLQ